MSDMNSTKIKHSRRKYMKHHKISIAIICLALVLCGSVGGTLAYLIATTGSLTNTFSAATIDNEIEEDFKDNVKSSITVTNTGDAEVYVRIKLVSYRVNEAGDHIGGSAPIDEFVLNSAYWFEDSGFYYYNKSIAANEETKNLLDITTDTGIILQEYNDADGGKQVIEVLSEVIQAEPDQAVIDAWGSNVATKLGITVSTTTN